MLEEPDHRLFAQRPDFCDGPNAGGAAHFTGAAGDHVQSRAKHGTVCAEQKLAEPHAPLHSVVEEDRRFTEVRRLDLCGQTKVPMAGNG